MNTPTDYARRLLELHRCEPHRLVYIDGPGVACEVRDSVCGRTWTLAGVAGQRSFRISNPGRQVG